MLTTNLDKIIRPCNQQDFRRQLTITIYLKFKTLGQITLFYEVLKHRTV